jgi:hypothetical protein
MKSRYRCFKCESEEFPGRYEIIIYKGKRGVTTGDIGVDEVGWVVSCSSKEIKDLGGYEISQLEALLLIGQSPRVFYEHIIKTTK